MSKLMNSALYELYTSPDKLIIQTTRSGVSIKVKIGTNGSFKVLFDDQNLFINAEPNERGIFVEKILQEALTFGENFFIEDNKNESAPTNSDLAPDPTLFLSEERIKEIVDAIKRGRRIE